MQSADKNRAITLLLVEPESLLRGTVASATRQLQLAQVQEATSVQAADRLLRQHRFDMLMMALDADGAALQVLDDLRRGRYLSDGHVPVAVLTDACNGELIGRLKILQVRKIVLKPFKARTLLDTIAVLAAEAADSPSHALEERD